MTFRGRLYHAALSTWLLSVTLDTAASVPLFEYESSALGSEALQSHGGEFSYLFTSVSGSSLSSGECKAYPGDTAWPSKEEWDALDKSMNGALIPTVPIAAPCYQDWNRFDQQKCDAIIANWTSPYFQYVSRHA